MKRVIFWILYVVFLTVPVWPQSSPAPTPEAAFLSQTQYTNAYFGFSIPLPEQQYRMLSNRSNRDSYQHFLFGIMEKDSTAIVIMADDTTGSSIKTPQDAFKSTEVKKTEIVRINNQDFVRGSWKKDKILRVMYATAIKGYVLQFAVFAYQERPVREFEKQLAALSFFDPADAKNKAGAESQPYFGPGP